MRKERRNPRIFQEDKEQDVGGLIIPPLPLVKNLGKRKMKRVDVDLMEQ